MWQKIIVITRKELYRTFTDRNLLVLMIVAPLGISTVVGLVFGGLGSGGSFSNIPVAIVNLDTGTEQQGQPINYGDQLVGLFIPNEVGVNNFGGVCPLIDDQPNDSGFNQSLQELVRAEQLDDVALGRAGVENGDYAVLITIPADFSTRLSPNINLSGQASEALDESTQIEIYANSGQSIEGVIIRSIVEGFTNQLLTGNIAIGASINALIQEDPLHALQLAADQANPDVAAIFGCGFMPGMATISLEPQPLTNDGDTSRPNLIQLILVQTGSAQAVFFALFAGQFGVLSIINERRAGTLQRMLISPTPRSVILIGKVFGTLATAVVQLTILLTALLVIASIIEGQLILIWGTNLLALVAVVLALALSVAGLGILMTSLARTPEQVGPLGAVINIVMVAVGGGFGFAPVFPLAYFSLVYWGMDAFMKLSIGNADILLNLVVLTLEGGLLFGVGLFLFNRRVEVV